jgi:hypothetical protein
LTCAIADTNPRVALQEALFSSVWSGSGSVVAVGVLATIWERREMRMMGGKFIVKSRSVNWVTPCFGRFEVSV